MELGTIVNYVQVGLWVAGGVGWAGKMKRDKKLELDPFKYLGNRVIGYALAAGLIISSLSLYYNLSRGIVTQTQSGYSVSFAPATLQVISNKTYFNEQVELDNKVFDNCTFESVKLMYHGFGQWRFINSHFSGDTYIATDNAGAKAFVELTTEFSKQVVPMTSTFGIDANGAKTLISGPSQMPKKDTSPSKK